MMTVAAVENPRRRQVNVAGVTSQKRLAAWADTIYDNYFPLDLKSPDADFTRGALGILDLPGVRFCSVDCDAMRVERRRCHLPLGGGDFLFLPIPLSAPLGLEQAGREVLLDPCDFGLITTADSYRYLQDSANQLVTLRIDARLARDRLPLIEDLTAIRFDSRAPLPRIFVDFVSSVMAQSAVLTAGDARALTPQLLDLLALALAAPIAALESEESAVRLAHLRRLYHVIDLHMSSVDLGPDLVARELGLSKRYIQKMLAERGETLSGFIRSRRIAEAQIRLSDPTRRGQSVAAIGYSLGFRDPAHFSRSFRAVSGLSPTAYRRLGDP
ncbi:MAG: helix-turn-helix domain-containing protein [Kiloniellales bacterium]